MTDKEIHEKWQISLNLNWKDLHKYLGTQQADIDFAKYYQTEQLILHGVIKSVCPKCKSNNTVKTKYDYWLCYNCSNEQWETVL